MNLHLVIRSFIIAVRYGYCSDLRYKLLTTAQQKDSYISSDLMIVVWTTYGNLTTLNSEIKSAMWRNQVEDKFFKFQFFEQIGGEIHDRFTD